MTASRYPLPSTRQRPRVSFKERAVILNGQKVKLSAQQFEVFLLPYMRGEIEVSELFDILFEHRRDGGPIEGVHYVDVVMWMMNSKLRRLGIKMSVSRTGWRAIMDLT